MSLFLTQFYELFQAVLYQILDRVSLRGFMVKENLERPVSNMDFGLVCLAALICAASVESVRQQHVSAVPLIVFLVSLLIVIWFRGRTSVARTPTMPSLTKLKRVSETEDEFANVALPSSVIYVLPGE